MGNSAGQSGWSAGMRARGEWAERAHGTRGEPYLLGDSQQDLVQCLHQLLESRPLRGRRVPALPHQPVPGRDGGRASGPGFHGGQVGPLSGRARTRG